MKLKLVVASMSILGLVAINFPAIAQDDTSDVTQTTQTTTKKISKVHKKKYAKPNKPATIETTVETEEVTYKGVETAEPICQISQSTFVLDSMTQNVGRSLPNPCNPGWFNRIAISGGINIDAGKWGNENANYMGENYQVLSLNDAYLNISADVNDWVKAFVSISYNTATINDPTNSTPLFHVAEYDAAYDDNITSGGSHKLQIEQAYVTIANFDQTPIFAQIGKQFADYGRYPLHPITESMTQVMTKTLATAAKVGFIANGFNGSAYIFDDPLSKVGKTSKTTNYGAALGYEMPNDHLGWSVGIGYLHNMIGVNDIAYSVNQFNINNVNELSGYHSRVGGVALYADINSGPFYLGARYTTSTSRFNALDLPKNGVADVTIDPTTNLGVLVDGAEGAKPWSAGILGAYGFTAFCNNAQTLFVGYQLSREAAGLNIPRQRVLAGYNIDVWTNTNLAVEWDHDIGYNAVDGGNGRVTNLVSLRLAVRFA